MSRHRFFLTADLCADGGAGQASVLRTLPLSEEDRHHAVSVLRVRAGEEIEAVDPAGGVWRMRVEHATRDELVAAPLGYEPPAERRRPRVVLVQGVAKGDKMDAIVRQAVEVGADEIVPVLTERSVVKLDPQKRAERAARWQRIARSAAEQAHRTSVPAVREPVALDSVGRELCADEALVVLWEDECAKTLAEALAPSRGRADARVMLVVGPEGGLSRAEVDALRAAGAVTATLGGTILRTETAAVVAVALTVDAGEHEKAIEWYTRYRELVPDAQPLAVAFRTLGCKVNRVESESIAAELLGRGCEVVAEDRAAVVVVNTCTVTGEADAKARKAVRRALKAPGEPVVVVTGCLAALDREGLLALGERVVVESDKERVTERVAELMLHGRDVATRSDHAALCGSTALPIPTAPPVPLAPPTPSAHGAAPSPASPPHSPDLSRVGGVFRTRAMVKVQDGCDNFCAYCIVPHARGAPRSVPSAHVVAEVTALVRAGVREVVLTGINMGRYRDGEVGLAELLAALAETGIVRLRLSSIEPPDVTPELLAAMARHADVVCPHLHVPLQSGSDRVLAAMERRYTTADFAKMLAAARAAVPRLAVTTDVIAGFPGETHEDASSTLRFCEAAGFARLHVFRYSPRPGTPAAERDDQVPAPVKAARAERLRELDARLRARHVACRAGEPVEVLVERVGEDHVEGTTRDYLRVRVASDGQDAAVGGLTTVVVTPESVLW